MSPGRRLPLRRRAVVEADAAGTECCNRSSGLAQQIARAMDTDDIAGTIEGQGFPGTANRYPHIIKVRLAGEDCIATDLEEHPRIPFAIRLAAADRVVVAGKVHPDTVVIVRCAVDDRIAAGRAGNYDDQGTRSARHGRARAEHGRHGAVATVHVVKDPQHGRFDLWEIAV